MIVTKNLCDRILENGKSCINPAKYRPGLALHLCDEHAKETRYHLRRLWGVDRDCESCGKDYGNYATHVPGIGYICDLCNVSGMETRAPKITLKNKEKFRDGIAGRTYIDAMITDGIETPILVTFISSEGEVGIYLNIYVRTTDKHTIDIDLDLTGTQHVMVVPGNVNDARKWFIENYYDKIHPWLRPQIDALQSTIMSMKGIFTPGFRRYEIPRRE